MALSSAVTVITSTFSSTMPRVTALTAAEAVPLTTALPPVWSPLTAALATSTSGWAWSWLWNCRLSSACREATLAARPCTRSAAYRAAL